MRCAQLKYGNRTIRNGIRFVIFALASGGCLSEDFGKDAGKYITPQAVAECVQMEKERAVCEIDTRKKLREKIGEVLEITPLVDMLSVNYAVGTKCGNSSQKCVEEGKKLTYSEANKVLELTRQKQEPTPAQIEGLAKELREESVEKARQYELDRRLNLVVPIGALFLTLCSGICGIVLYIMGTRSIGERHE